MESQTHSKGGRPSSYKPEYVDELLKYFKSFTDEPFTKEVVSKTIKYYDSAHGGGVKESHEDYKFVPKKFPSLFGFSRTIGFPYWTVWNWANQRIGEPPKSGERDTRFFKYEGFSNAYKQAKLFQTEYLTAVGLGGLAPSAFAIFTAKNTIGWRDKSEVGLTDQDGKTVAGGFILLPKRLSPEEAEKEFEEQEAVEAG